VVEHVLNGTVTHAELQTAGATLLAPSQKPAQGGPPNCTGTGSEYGSSFPQNGNWTAIQASDPPTPGIYAVSIPGVLPSACLSWFQAAQACAVSGKRLPTNQEWQLAAAGTPDTTDCNGATGIPSKTGALANCRSVWGTFDMVGNVAEWVADWVPLSSDCPGWGPFSADLMCLAGAATVAGPGAIMRGGSCCAPGADPGVFFVDGQVPPTNAVNFDFGFRCVR
jgi:formylglycine-generating enzyme required for sulfatase activity